MEDIDYIVLVFDDLMLKIVQLEDCVYLFIVISYYWNVSFIFLIQNFYLLGKYLRIILLNCLNVILFKNYRDLCQVIIFGFQIVFGKFLFFKFVYELVICENYGYLYVCLEFIQNKLY